MSSTLTKDNFENPTLCQPYCCIWREFAYSSPILTPKESRHSLLDFVVDENTV